MFHPLFIIAVTEVLTGMRAAAFLAIGRRIHGHRSLRDQIVKFERLDEIRVPDHRAVLNINAGKLCKHGINFLDAFTQDITGAVNGAVFLHCFLHLEAQRSDRMLARSVPHFVKAGNVLVRGGICQFRLARAGIKCVSATQTGCAAKDNQVDQRV